MTSCAVLTLLDASAVAFSSRAVCSSSTSRRLWVWVAALVDALERSSAWFLSASVIPRTIASESLDG